MLLRSATHTSILILVIVLYSAGQSNDSKPTSDTQATIVGVWRGNSICSVKDSACHDEENVYRITANTGRPGWVTVVGSKIVDGKEIVMGSLEWRFDEQKRTLDSPDGAFHFTVQGDTLDGTLTRNNQVFRRIHLKREALRAVFSAPRAEK